MIEKLPVKPGDKLISGGTYLILGNANNMSNAQITLEIDIVDNGPDVYLVAIAYKTYNVNAKVFDLWRNVDVLCMKDSDVYHVVEAASKVIMFDNQEVANALIAAAFGRYTKYS